MLNSQRNSRPKKEKIKPDSTVEQNLASEEGDEKLKLMFY